MKGATLAAAAPDREQLLPGARQPTPGPAGRGGGWNAYVVWAAVFAGLGGMLFGYDIGVISGAMLQLESDFSLHSYEKSLVVSLMLVGAMVASMVGGFIIDAVGRRNGILINTFIFTGGAAILTLADRFLLLLMGRFVVGFAVALSAIAEIVYISEIAPASARGALVSVNEMGISVGICCAYVANFCLIDVRHGWRYMFAISAGPAILQGIGMAFFPASPRWLLFCNQEEAARKSLQKFRGPGDDIDAELRAIRDSALEERAAKSSDLLFDKTLRWTLIVACGLILFQQLTGQPNVLYFASSIFKSAGFRTDKQATAAQMILGLIKVVSTGLALSRVDHVGRRWLLLVGTAVMVVSLAALSLVTMFGDVTVVPNAGNHTNGTGALAPLVADAKADTIHTPLFVRWVSLASLCTFVSAYAFSYGPVSWLLLSELFPNGIRGRAVSYATVLNWGGNLIVSSTFLSFEGKLGFSGTFGMYAIIGVLSFGFILAFIPETKGRSLEDISTLMHLEAHKPGCGGRMGSIVRHGSTQSPQVRYAAVHSSARGDELLSSSVVRCT